MAVSDNEVYDALRGMIQPNVTDILQIRRVIRQNRLHRSVAPLLERSSVKALAKIARRVIVVNPTATTSTAQQNVPSGPGAVPAVIPVSTWMLDVPALSTEAVSDTQNNGQGAVGSGPVIGIEPDDHEHADHEVVTSTPAMAADMSDGNGE